MTPRHAEVAFPVPCGRHSEYPVGGQALQRRRPSRAAVGRHDRIRAACKTSPLMAPGGETQEAHDVWSGGIRVTGLQLPAVTEPSL